MNALCWTYIRTKTREAMAMGMQDVVGETVKLTPGAPTVVRADGGGEQSLWTYLTEMARRSMTAGVHDALGKAMFEPQIDERPSRDWDDPFETQGGPTQ